MPKVSIIIPCYNQAEFLLQALEALQKQTLKDFECIIVDDGSTDSSAQIADEFIKQDNRFRLIRKPNGGTATARNMGLRTATGNMYSFWMLATNWTRRSWSFNRPRWMQRSWT